jgi:hypothetical protein
MYVYMYICVCMHVCILEYMHKCMYALRLRYVKVSRDNHSNHHCNTDYVCMYACTYVCSDCK